MTMNGERERSPGKNRNFKNNNNNNSSNNKLIQSFLAEIIIIIALRIKASLL